MTDHDYVFLSYSRNDLEAAALLRAQLVRQGLTVFKDDDTIREGDLWLARLQDAVDACGSFVVLVGKDGVRRWIGAETQAALLRHFGPHEDANRLPIFPILLGDTQGETLPGFLKLFQATSWNGSDPLPERLLEQIRERTLVTNEAAAFEGCPFVGLAAYQMKQAHLFFGRQKDTLDALACFDTRRGMRPVRWLEINGNSGSGKSSLMNAGLLPLVDQGWLWPRTGFAHWRRIGPLMPGAKPVEMLAEHLAGAFGAEMADVYERLKTDDPALAHWLRTRKQPDTAFLLAIDQFEELFTFADPDERSRFDRLLSYALEDADCPLFVISTVRADFLDRFEDLPRLAAVRSKLGRLWPLPPMGADGLRQVITGPARLARLDVSEVTEAMVAEARDEPGALPLVENALQWLWNERQNGRLGGKLFTDQGGLAGILSRNADDLLDGLGGDRTRALKLLFRLVNVDQEGRKHTRRRIPLVEAVEVAGGGERGRALVNRLAGERARDAASASSRGPLRLITVSGETPAGSSERGNGRPVDHAAGTPTANPRPGIESQRQSDGERWVNLIHETLIRSRGRDAGGKPQPFWPTLWNYVEQHKEWATRRERLQLQAREWKERRGLARIFGLAGWSGLFTFRGLAGPDSIEQRYLRWSRAVGAMQLGILASVIGIAGLLAEAAIWASTNRLPPTYMWQKQLWRLGLRKPLPEWVEIKPGGFIMGCRAGRDDVEGYTCSSDDRPHPVTLTRAYALGKQEVTVEQYAYYLWEKGRDDSGNLLQYSLDVDWSRRDHPMTYVDWDEVRDYARWLHGKVGSAETVVRLPTEAEWEYAARAGSETAYWWGGEKFDPLHANCDRQAGGTMPVGADKQRENGFGLQDMLGNVSEWVADEYRPYAEDSIKDPLVGKYDSANVSRVLRGGAWLFNPGSCRAAARDRNHPFYRFKYFGFRVCRGAPIETLDAGPLNAEPLKP